jgi:2-phosphosulfolactate phosphatase
LKTLEQNIKIQKLHKPEQVEAEFVIVIDVIRAFTTAAYAFGGGAEKIIIVSSPQEAFALKKDNPEFLLMGEVGGKHIPGFDFCNSPVNISKADIKGKTLVQRTTSGTQGVVRSIKSKRILCSSFAIANATLKRIQSLTPTTITFI